VKRSATALLARDEDRVRDDAGVAPAQVEIVVGVRTSASSSLMRSLRGSEKYVSSDQRYSIAFGMAP
jgi:hypothetical protein